MTWLFPFHLVWNICDKKSKCRFHILKIKKKDSRSLFSVSSRNVIKYQTSSPSWYTRWFLESFFLSYKKNTIEKHFFYREVQLGGFKFLFFLVPAELDVLLGIKVTYFHYKDETFVKMDIGWLGQFLLLTAFHLHSKWLAQAKIFLSFRKLDRLFGIASIQ